MLIHTDDATILASSRGQAEAKLKLLLHYCALNHITLQLSKCEFIVINGDMRDKENETSRRLTETCSPCNGARQSTSRKWTSTQLVFFCSTKRWKQTSLTLQQFTSRACTYTRPKLTMTNNGQNKAFC